MVNAFYRSIIFKVIFAVGIGLGLYLLASMASANPNYRDIAQGCLLLTNGVLYFISIRKQTPYANFIGWTVMISQLLLGLWCFLDQ